MLVYTISTALTVMIKGVVTIWGLLKLGAVKINIK